MTRRWAHVASARGGELTTMCAAAATRKDAARLNFLSPSKRVLLKELRCSGTFSADNSPISQEPPDSPSARDHRVNIIIIFRLYLFCLVFFGNHHSLRRPEFLEFDPVSASAQPMQRQVTTAAAALTMLRRNNMAPESAVLKASPLAAH
jgi:hypothetical protein